MGETSNFYEKCSSLSKKGDEKSLRTLLQMGISGNKTARVALRKTRNKKLLKTLIDEYLDNIPSEYNAGMILNLAVKVLRKEYLYVYLMEIFHEKKDLKEIGFFKSVKDIPLDKQEQIEVKKYIIDTKDFDIRLISLIAVEEREDILYALLTKAMDDGLDARTTKIFLANKDYLQLIQPELREAIEKRVEGTSIFATYLDLKEKDMMPQLVIDDITKKIPMYTHFIKLDVKSFYGSINHDKLIKIIKRKIHKAEIISIIWNAIRTEALLCPIKEKTVKKERILGVPEGLPISNTLANIYMQDIDIKYRNLDYISYYRYVDDILILVNEDKFYDVKRSICDDINKLGLELNDKEDEGFVTQTFEYLGYVLNDSEVTVRKSSILKIEQSIEELFRTIKKENIEYLQWKLNLKITGFIIERHKYGWLFFYSQITDLSLLFHLDDVVQKLIKRYKLEGEIKVKRFVRTYAEMHMALHETKYIPNLDDLGLDDKKAILSDIYQIDLSDKDERFVEIQFHRIMKREIRDIEKDIENIS